jgi:hypothetical protein
VNAIAEPRASLVAVPTLAEVAADPRLIERLPAPVCGALSAQASALAYALATRYAIAAQPATLAPADADELVDLADAARRLGMARSTLAKRVGREPYRDLIVRNGTRRLLFSTERIRTFLAVKNRR